MTVEFRKKAFEEIKAYARARRAEKLREKYHPKPKPPAAAEPAAPAAEAEPTEELDVLLADS